MSKQDAHSSICADREWAEIVAELDRRGLMWIVADIIAGLVPTGRAAVEAHKAIYDYLSPQHVSRTQRLGYRSLLSYSYGCINMRRGLRPALDCV